MAFRICQSPQVFLEASRGNLGRKTNRCKNIDIYIIYSYIFKEISIHILYIYTQLLYSLHLYKV